MHSTNKKPNDPGIFSLLGLLCTFATLAQPAHAQGVNPTQLPAYRTVTRSYATDSPYRKGLLERETLTDAQGRAYTETRHRYTLLQAADSAAFPVPAEEQATSLTATLYPALTRTEQHHYEGGQGNKSSTQYFEYGPYGNVIRFADSGDVGSEDDVQALIDYANCPASHIVGQATRILVTDGGGRLLRQREGQINCANGELSQLRQYVESGVAVTDLVYEANGNLKRVTGPANLKGQRYQLDYSYDTAVATHVIAVSDSFGYTSTASHDYRWAKPLSTTDLNGKLISYAYDGFGRTVAITGPYEQAQNRVTLGFAYGHDAAVPWAKTSHYNRDAVGRPLPSIDTVLLIDGMRRIIQTKKDASVQGQGDVMTVSGQVEFDAYGRTVRQYYPVTEPKARAEQGNTAYNPAYDSVAPTEIEHDVLDRNIRTRLPDGSTTSQAYGFGADRAGALQFQTTVTDANGKQKQSLRDVRQLITAVRESNAGQILWTSYAYDPLKQITRVVDAKNNVTTVEYDQLGRRTAITNPDTGKTETVYDLASNPVKKITAVLRLNQQAIAYGYDYNRLASISYPVANGQPSDHDVAYSYGANSPEFRQYNQVGRIVSIQSQAGLDERRYGKLGELIWERKTLSSATQGNSPSTSSGQAPSPPSTELRTGEVYTTQYDFDTFGRLMLLTLPDGEVLTHAYDSGGNLARIEGDKTTSSAQGAGPDHTVYLDSLLYDKFEQRTALKLGNGVETTYSYRADNRRLQRLVSIGAPAGVGQSDGKFQNLAYGYDVVGNILSLSNEVAIPPPSGMGGPSRQSFAYDELYRLSGAQGRFQSSPDKVRDYALAMRYDTIHNITAKTQSDVISSAGNKGVEQKATSYDWAYAYGGVQPHAPSHIGTRSYFHDANGNQTGWSDDRNGTRRTISWDEDNRIREVEDNGQSTRFKYDDQGQRVFKIGQQGETVYVNQFYVVRNRSIVSKHVFAGTSRIATKLVNGNGNSNNSRSAGGLGSLGTGLSGTSLSAGTSTLATGNSLSRSAGEGRGEGGSQGNAYAYGQSPEGKDKGRGQANGKGQANGPSTSSGQASGGLLPGNSQAGLENALANGEGHKYGIYKHLEREGATVDAGGRIVAVGGGDGGGVGVGGGGSSLGGSGSPGGSAWKPEENFLYYYHPDHLGSTGHVTDGQGKLYEHIQYFPFGETWVQEHSNTRRTPYLFTGKELDQETGLYYFGARYYDPRASVWQSADPIVGRYLNGGPSGGVYAPANLALFTYVHGNPVRLIDPNGESVWDFIAGVGNAMSSNFTVGAIPRRQGNLDMKLGQATGDVASIIMGIGEVGGGTGLMGVGLAATPTGVGTAPGLATVAAGAAVTTHGASMATNAAKNLGMTLSEALNGGAGGSTGTGNRFPDRDLPRDKHGNPVPDPEAGGAHTQLGQKSGRNGRYDQAREFDANGKPVRDIDFTDHGRPGSHPNPHQHEYLPNSTGGTPQRGPTKPLSVD